jgi:hypothetical protein
MAYSARMELGLFERPENDALRARALKHLCAAFQGIDEDFIAAHPELPPVTTLLAHGVVRPRNAPRVCDANGCYIAEDPWQDIPTILNRRDRFGRPDRVADERDLAVWNAAEASVRRRDPSRVTFLREDMSPIGRTYVARMLLGLFNGPSDRDLSDRAIRRLCRAFQNIGEDYLRANPDTPLLYDLGRQGLVRYQRDDKVCDQNGCRIVEDPWQDIPRSIALGIVDCEDASTWCAAERVVRYGIPARADIIAKDLPPPDGRRLYHIIVRYPRRWIAYARRMGIPVNDDGIEDPNVPLGMKGFGGFEGAVVQSRNLGLLVSR